MMGKMVKRDSTWGTKELGQKVRIFLWDND